MIPAMSLRAKAPPVALAKPTIGLSNVMPAKRKAETRPRAFFDVAAYSLQFRFKQTPAADTHSIHQTVFL